MAMFEGSSAASTRSRLRGFIRSLAGRGDEQEEGESQLQSVLRLRGELAAGHGDLLRMLAPNAVADALGDPDRIAAYAESLAAEALIRHRAGESERAEALRTRAVAVAREAKQRARAPDTAIDQLIARAGRLSDEDATDRTS
jgi:hypothetical protein